MRTPFTAPRHWRALSVPLVLAGALTALAPAASASAATCASFTAAQPPSPGNISNDLAGVTVLSACNAWAVGFTASTGHPDQLLTEHWNGSSWTVFPAQNPSSVRNRFEAVSAVSGNDIWAVGRDTTSADNDLALIEHWNGSSWSFSSSPVPGSESELNGVHVVSANDIWAVGDFTDSTGTKTLIDHWNGRTWTQVRSPNPGTAGSGDILTAVSASSAGNAWAVGRSDDGKNDHTLVLHWNGSAWKSVISPDPGTSNFLRGVSVTSPSNAWAVGESFNGGTNTTLVLHWNGSKWTHTPSPSPGSNDELFGVAATSAGNAWAVGDRLDASPGGSTDDTLILHWNGRSWSALHSPDPGAANGSVLGGVAPAPAGSAPAGSAWAVGTFGSTGPGQAMAVHCC
jgi:hypothetical protein